MLQEPHSITDELLNQIMPAAHAGSAPEGPFVLIILCHLEWWECHITVGAHYGCGEPWEVFDFASVEVFLVLGVKVHDPNCATLLPIFLFCQCRQ
jgi:hypothetical protein